MLEPGRLLKTDKVEILSDVDQVELLLRNEA